MGRVIVTALLGLAGAVALAVLTPRHDPLALYGYRVSADAARARARELAGAWRWPAVQGPMVLGVTDSERSRWWFQRTGTTRDALNSPTNTTVYFRPARITFAPDGRLLRFRRAPESAGPPRDPDRARQQAEQALSTLTGAQRHRFRLTVDVGLEDQHRKYRWEWTRPDPAQLAWTVDVLVDAQGVREADLQGQLSGEWDRQFRAAESAEAVLAAPMVVLTMVGVLLVPIVALLAWLRRALVLRVAWVVLGLLLLLAVAQAATLPALRQWSAPERPGVPETLEFVLGHVVAAVLFAAAVAAGAFAASGDARWRTLRLIVAGRPWCKEVGRSLLGGLTVALPLAALGPALLATGIVTGWAFDLPLQALGSEHPGWWAVTQEPPLLVAGYFAFLLPFARRWQARRAWVAGVAALPGALIAVSAVPYDGDVAGGYLYALLLFLLAAWAWYAHGLLAVLVALWAFPALQLAATLSALPGDLSAEAAPVWWVMGALFGAGTLVSVFGRHDAPVEEAAEAIPLYVSEREQLRSDFSLARRAQQHMLPGGSPSLPGFEFAATCQPARDVGGDLYDYVPLHDGRLAVCVADVSGKGMPAALYMTLTKGAMVAGAQFQRGPAEIARRLNTHLYAAGRRRVFVTAALGALCPRTQCFEYVRAGHNPVLWRRAALGETRLLHAPGMGLGLAAPAVFDRALRAECVQLEPGDALVLYSDGVTEAMDADQQEFGEERLCRAVAAADGENADGVQQRILTDLQEFLGGAPPQDDLTLVVVRVSSTGGV